MSVVVTSFAVRNINILNNYLFGDITLLQKASGNISVINSTLNYGSSISLNAGNYVNCYNSSITSPDIYLPIAQHVLLEDCYINGNIHYGEF